MGQIVCVGTLLMAVGTAVDDLALSFAGTLLIGGQLMISYFFAGFAKLLSPEWRRGQALIGIMGTHSYGHSIGARVVSANAALSACLCWALMIGETLFPLAIFLPRNLCLLAFAGSFAFHIATAYFMGLNTFVWAFAAALPSAMMLNVLATHALGAA